MNTACTVEALTAGDRTVVDDHVSIFVDVNNFAVVFTILETAVDGVTVEVERDISIFGNIDGAPRKSVAPVGGKSPAIAEHAVFVSVPIAIEINNNARLFSHFLLALGEINCKFPAVGKDYSSLRLSVLVANGAAEVIYNVVLK